MDGRTAPRTAAMDTLLLLCCCFTSTVNILGHVGMVHGYVPLRSVGGGGVRTSLGEWKHNNNNSKD